MFFSILFWTWSHPNTLSKRRLARSLSSSLYETLQINFCSKEINFGVGYSKSTSVVKNKIFENPQNIKHLIFIQKEKLLVSPPIPFSAYTTKPPPNPTAKTSVVLKLAFCQPTQLNKTLISVKRLPFFNEKKASQHISRNLCVIPSPDLNTSFKTIFLNFQFNSPVELSASKKPIKV